MSNETPVSRRALIGAAVGAAALTAGVGVAPASAAVADLNGTWKLNGNGYLGDLVITHDKKSPSRFSGTMYGEQVNGAYSALQRTFVIFRGNPRNWLGDFNQIFVGQVSATGQSMSGSFFATNAAYGASAQRIEYSFAARRGSSAPSIPPAPTHPAGPPSMAGKYDLRGTIPLPPQPVRLTLNDTGGELWGDVHPGTFGWSEGWIAGRYAAASGALFLTEHTFSWPGALFVGSTVDGWAGRIQGTYYKFEHITPPANGGGVNSGDHRRVIGLWEPMAYTWFIDT